MEIIELAQNGVCTFSMSDGDWAVVVSGLASGLIHCERWRLTTKSQLDSSNSDRKVAQRGVALRNSLKAGQADEVRHLTLDRDEIRTLVTILSELANGFDLPEWEFSIITGLTREMIRERLIVLHLAGAVDGWERAEKARGPD